MKIFGYVVFAIVFWSALAITPMRDCNAQGKKHDCREEYLKGFRPLPAKVARQMPPAPVLEGPGERDPHIGYAYQWQVNKDTGEFLYRRLGKSDIELIVTPNAKP